MSEQRVLSPDEIAPFLRSALNLTRKEDYLEPARLPASALAQSPDPGVSLTARMTSGVRLAFETNSPFVALDVFETALQYVGEPRRASTFDLTIDGEFAGRAETSTGTTIVLDVTKVPPAVRIVRGEPSIIRFEGLSPNNKAVELWLPHAAMVRLRGLHIAKDAQIRETRRSARAWAHYGSSISHGMEAEGPSETWPVVAARKMGLELIHMGFGGQCHVDGFAARAIRDSGADLISLKLGINVVNGDTMRERAFRPAVDNFLDTIREKKPGTPIVVVSPILCPAAETNPGPTLRDGAGFVTRERSAELSVGALTLSRIRQILEEIVTRRRAAGDVNLHYLSGLELFSEPDLADLPDGLHPNAAGLRRMGERFAALARPHFA
jgi:lysophospholipase L1-like esterase